MADTYGLLGALTQGINSGVESYQSAKKQALQNKYQQNQMRNQNLDTSSKLATAGQQVDPNDPNSVINDPDSVTKINSERNELQKGTPEAKGLLSVGQNTDKTMGTHVYDNVDPETVSVHDIQNMQKIGQPEGRYNQAMATTNLSGGYKVKAADRFATTRKDANQQRESDDYSKDSSGIAVPEKMINASNRSMELIEDMQLDKADPKKLISTKALNSELVNNVASMLNQGKPATVSGAKDVKADTAYSELQNAWHFADGTPKDTVTAADLQQTYKDLKALGSNYVNQHERSFRSWVSNRPESLKQGDINRYNQFRGDNGLPSYNPNKKVTPTSLGKQIQSQDSGGLINKTQPGNISGKIKVSNGKETLMIDPKDAADAQKDGYQVMK